MVKALGVVSCPVCGGAVGDSGGGGGGGLPTCNEDVGEPSMSALSSNSGSGEGVGGTSSKSISVDNCALSKRGPQW